MSMYYMTFLLDIPLMEFTRHSIARDDVRDTDLSLIRMLVPDTMGIVRLPEPEATWLAVQTDLST